MSAPGTCPVCGAGVGTTEVCHTEPVGAAELAQSYICTECHTEWQALFRFDEKVVR